MDAEKIIEYKLDQQQIQAYRLVDLWNSILQEQIPEQYKQKKTINGDPRKTNLFRYCYKLVRETQGLLEESEYKSYFLAQIVTMKTYQGLINPQILVGDKAWKRWKYWKYKTDKVKTQTLKIQENTYSPKFYEIKAELQRTKDFLIYKFGNIPKDISQSEIKKWYFFDKVSGYFLKINQIDIESSDLYEINDEVLSAYKEVFDE